MRFSLSPDNEAMFRERSAKPPMVLRRRKCACGAVVTALQLTRFGKCEKCVGVR
jgi:hypothetical protein